MIKRCSVPQSKEELQSLLGMTNYLGRFIPNMSQITEPLRNLTRQDTVWNWGDKQDSALATLKNSLSSQSTLAYFDVSKETVLLVDASPFGLGAILAQRTPGQPDRAVALASRALTPTEQRYSQIEREALAVFWSVMHFHLHVYGDDFKVITDHRPLEPLFNKAGSKPPARIERWILRLQGYRFTVEYQPGKLNPADYLSRHPLNPATESSREEAMTEEYVNYLTQSSTPKAITVDEIIAATSEDTAIQLCCNALQTGRWHDNLMYAKTQTDVYDELQSLFRVREELTVSQSGILLRDTRIVIPRMLVDRVINIAHDTHQGITKTKSLLREKVWFSGMDLLVENKIGSCIQCQSAVTDNRKESLKMSELPRAPWTEVSVDFAELPNGKYLLVVVDDYSRYPEVDVVSSTSAKSVIPKLDRMFSQFGVPETVKSDNGPPFNGAEFKQFAEYMGFHHRRITPYWPRANGEVERFMRTLKKHLRTTDVPLKQGLFKFLRDYRATPHTSTKIAPATALFGRPIRVRLPEMVVTPSNDDIIKTHDDAAKRQMKHFNKDKGKPKPQVGDCVIVKRRGYIGKYTSPYDKDPYIVMERKGTMISAERPTDGHNVTRNMSEFKSLKHLPAPNVPEAIPERSTTANTPDQLPSGTDTAPEALMPNVDECTPNTPIKPSSNSPRPTRDRKPPAYLKDFVEK